MQTTNAEEKKKRANGVRWIERGLERDYFVDDTGFGCVFLLPLIIEGNNIWRLM